MKKKVIEFDQILWKHHWIATFICSSWRVTCSFISVWNECYLPCGFGKISLHEVVSEAKIHNGCDLFTKRNGLSKKPILMEVTFWTTGILFLCSPWSKEFQPPTSCHCLSMKLHNFFRAFWDIQKSTIAANFFHQHQENIIFGVKKHTWQETIWYTCDILREK